MAMVDISHPEGGTAVDERIAKLITLIWEKVGIGTTRQEVLENGNVFICFRHMHFVTSFMEITQLDSSSLRSERVCVGSARRIYSLEFSLEKVPDMVKRLEDV
ncbi:MAG: hypothetical protein ACAH35_05215 [Candidatus Paceibacterota bacterium]